MKRIVYSAVVKLVAVLLFIACTVCGVLSVMGGIVEYAHEEKDIYSFEPDFSQSWYLSSLLSEPEHILYHAYQNVFYTYGEYVETTGGSIVREENTGEKHDELRNSIMQGFADYFPDKINYYVQWNDLVITNCEAVSAEELAQGEFYSYVKRDGTKGIERISSGMRNIDPLIEYITRFDSTSTIIISCNVKQETVEEYQAIWEKQQGIVINTMMHTLVCAVGGLLLLIYLICVCGKNKNGEYTNMWLDHIWLEIHLCLIAGFGLGAVAVCVMILDEYLLYRFPERLIYLIAGSASALGSMMMITSLLSVIRNIKMRRLFETSIILRVLRWLIRLLVKIVKWIWRITKTFWTAIFRLLSKKAGVLFISMLFIYTVLIGILGIGTAFSPVWFIIGVLLFVFACFVLAYRANDFDEIKKGVSEVRNGKVSYKIPVLNCDDMRALAVNLNDLAKGLDEAVSAKVKSERLKTELITNVSHDLKTPITSIINYTELLSKIDELPEEAKDYVAVIAKKGDRLKQLTQDLFDISKVQSGNDDVIWEKLDISLLINQALGEFDNEIQRSGLPFCVEAPNGLYISADGRKISRVLSNLIDNILKYTMKNTRIFITVSEKDGDIVIELKNISAYPLNFHADEITRRFVRGDESRATEGNGLGLAIAKSYSEVCNGSFEIVIDGDMFKVILQFPKCV